jgi:hypothetical protein
MANPRFTQKHFRSIASILAFRRSNIIGELTTASNSTFHTLKTGQLSEVENIALALAEVFQADNPKFSRTLFLDVCRGNKAPTARPVHVRCPRCQQNTGRWQRKSIYCTTCEQVTRTSL